MSTKQWIAYEYGKFYDIAENRPNMLYFDVRCWNTSEVFEFFDDLRYCDYETYEKIIRRFPEFKQTDFKTILKKNKGCEQKYMKWKLKQTSEFLKWRK